MNYAKQPCYIHRHFLPLTTVDCRGLFHTSYHVIVGATDRTLSWRKVPVNRYGVVYVWGETVAWVSWPDCNLSKYKCFVSFVSFATPIILNILRHMFDVHMSIFASRKGFVIALCKWQSYLACFIHVFENCLQSERAFLHRSIKGRDTRFSVFCNVINSCTCTLLILTVFIAKYR